MWGQWFGQDQTQTPPAFAVMLNIDEDRPNVGTAHVGVRGNQGVVNAYGTVKFEADAVGSLGQFVPNLSTLTPPAKEVTSLPAVQLRILKTRPDLRLRCQAGELPPKDIALRQLDKARATRPDKKFSSWQQFKRSAGHHSSASPPALRKAFGRFKLARTAAESGRHDVLRMLDVDQYLRKHEGARGAVQANRVIAVLSAMFAFGRRCGMTSYNPCEGAERNTEQPRKRVLSAELRTQIMAVASPALRLMCELSDVTSMRKTDVRLLLLSKVGPDEIIVESSKTGIKRAYQMTPAVRAVLQAAAKLPGRKISLYVFPTRRGTPYSESVLQTLWKRAKEKAGLADDKSSGRIVWQDVVDYGGDFGDLATSLSVDEHRLFVAGTAATTTSVGYFVRAYDAKTGELLWERNSVENNPELFIFTTARVVAHGNRVFVGVSLGSELPISGFVYAFDARTGKLAWQDEIRTGGDADLIAGLATADGRVFAVADGGKQCLNDASPPSNCNTVVRAYHAEKGKLLWEQEFDLSGVDDFATGITAEGNNVYLSLTGGPATFPLGDAMGVWQVRALDASNGRLRWEHVVPSDVTIGDAERALDLASQDGELFVVGRTLFDFGCCDFTVRAYNTNP